MGGTLSVINTQPLPELSVKSSAPLPQGSTPGAGQITGISAQPKSTGVLNSIERWAQNVSNDIKNGTDVTGVGTVLKKMGAHGVYSGEPEPVGDFMASLPLGLLRATKGAAEIPQSGKTWQGTKDLTGGTLQAVTIPSAFVGGPAVEEGSEAIAAGTGKIFGNVERAGQLFNQVKAAAKTSEVPVTDEMYAAASRAMDLADTGAKGLPRVIFKFMNRVTAPYKEPIAWDEARDFYSNVSRLSANEYQNMNPQMAAAVGRFAGAFDDSLRAVAAAAGQGDQYSEAMQLYRTAKSWQRFGANVWSGVKKALPFAGGAAAGSAIGSGATRRLLDLMQ